MMVSIKMSSVLYQLYSDVLSDVERILVAILLWMYTNYVSKLILYHGSDHIVEKPSYGYGKLHNDYGQGFYCTQDPELAKEWSVTSTDGNGYVNIYEFDDTDLNVLNLDNKSILTWISILLVNRTFEVRGALAGAALAYLKDNFLIDCSGYDAIYGWRADDSYFAYASDFINGTLSVQRLGRAMRFGNLGMQYVLKSKEAFDRIVFKESMLVPSMMYYKKRMARDAEARESYLYGERQAFDKDDIFITDIMRQEIGRDDPRLQ